MENKYKKSERTRQEIENKFLEMLREKDICDIKVKHITDALGIDRSTFYSYYSSIYDLAETIESRFFPPDPDFDPERFAIANSRINVDNKDALATLLTYSEHEPMFKTKVDQRRIKQIPYLFNKHGIELSDSEKQMYAQFMISGYNGLALYFFSDECDFTELEIAEIMNNMITQNMLTLYQLTTQIRLRHADEKGKQAGTGGNETIEK